MSFMKPQPVALPSEPTPVQSPIGTKPKPKPSTPSFLGSDYIPQSPNTSNKTLIGQ